MKFKASLLTLAVAVGAMSICPGDLVSVLDWTGDVGIVGNAATTLNGSITDATPGGSVLKMGDFGFPTYNPDGIQLANISDGRYDPDVIGSPSYVAPPDTPAGSSEEMGGYSYLSENVGSSTSGGTNDPDPTIIFDLGADTVISGYQIWNYRNGDFSSNKLEDYTLRFATAAEGTGGFGASISDISATAGTGNDTGLIDITDVTARYIEFSMLSRHSGRKVGVEEIQFDLSAVSQPSAAALADFSYDPSDGSAEVSIADGAPNTKYKLVEADDLDFTNPNQTITPTSVTAPATLDGNEVTTDGSGNATVQFNLGNSKDATFLRAETVVP